MELEFHQIVLRYQHLRAYDRKGMGSLLSSLASNGQLQPVLVVKQDDDKYVLIDGYRRVKALKRLGGDTVFVLVLSLKEQEGLVFLHRAGHDRQRSALEDGWLVQELKGRYGMSLDTIAVALERSKSWVSRRLSLVEVLPKEVQKEVRKGRLCAHSAGKHLVPLARANKKECIELVSNLAGQGLSSRATGRVCEAVRQSRGKVRRRIVEDPQLYLRVEDERARETPPIPDEDWADLVLGEVERLAWLCRKARTRLSQGVLKSGGWFPHHERLLDTWRITYADFHALTQTIKEVLDAGSGHTHGDTSPSRRGARDKGHRSSSKGVEKHGQEGAQASY